MIRMSITPGAPGLYLQVIGFSCGQHWRLTSKGLVDLAKNCTGLLSICLRDGALINNAALTRISELLPNLIKLKNLLVVLLLLKEFVN